jgi:DNA-binding protein YbaB
MANEAAKDQLAALSESFQAGLRSLHQMQQRRAQLSAAASAAAGQVTVTVDADGIPTNIEFSSEIESLSYAEMADAVVRAARDAAADVRRQAAGVVATLQQEDPSLPKLSDFLPGAPDLMELVPGVRATLLTPPETATRRGDDEQAISGATPQSLDVEVVDRGWESDSSADSKRVIPDTQEDYEHHHSGDSEVSDRG